MATEKRRPSGKGSGTETVHPVTAYAKSVVEGRVVAGKWVRLACERHLRDLESGAERGWRFDEEAVDRAFAFFHRLSHSKGEWAGKPFLLAPWQEFVVGSLFGWKGADGLRRFRVAYVETSKKSGKTTLLAGLGLLATFGDDPIERGAEGYFAATKRDQAKIAWSESRSMVTASPGLRKHLRVWGGTGPRATGTISLDRKAQKLEPIGKDSKGLEGINPHFAGVDELHRWPDRGIWDILLTSTKARRQPLTVAITNSGHDEQSLCFEEHEHGKKVLEGVLQDDRYFAFICAIDKGDDWADERNWPKANPGLGITVKVEDYREDCEKAKASPGFAPNFRRYYCGVWEAVEERAIDMDRWSRCGEPFDLAILRGRTCFGGLDLSTAIDLTAWVLLFPPTEGKKPKREGDPEVLADPYWRVLCRFFIPEEKMLEAERRDRVPYLQWRKEGLVAVTPGSVVDYAFVQHQILGDAKAYPLRSIGFDPWQAERTREELEAEGLQMIKIRQGHPTLSLPTKKLEALYTDGKLRHGGNPVLRWMAANVVWRRDANANFIPDKGRAGRHRQRIDGISALVNALAASEFTPPPPPRPYENRGVTFI